MGDMWVQKRKSFKTSGLDFEPMIVSLDCFDSFDSLLQDGNIQWDHGVIDKMPMKHWIGKAVVSLCQ